MSCIWKFCFTNTVKKEVKNLPPIKVESPLYLEDDSNDKVTLKAMEAAIIDTLVAIHYSIEDTKTKLANGMRNGSTEQVRAFLAKKSHLLDKKFLLEKKLERVQAKLRAFE
jgi:hypothetical protein